MSYKVLLLGSVALFGLSLIVLAPTEALREPLGITVVVAWCLLAGLGSGLFQVPVANIVLRDLPEELRGRGVGLIQTVLTMFMIVGVALGGLVAELTGVGISIVMAGALLLAVTAVAAAPKLRLAGSRPAISEVTK
jgi:MFS family permease